MARLYDTDYAPGRGACAYSRWRAHAAFENVRTGRFQTGERAVVTIVDLDPANVGTSDPWRLPQNTALCAIVEGRVAMQGRRAGRAGELFALTRARDPVKSAGATRVPTPIELITGVWLAVWPAWGAAILGGLSPAVVAESHLAVSAYESPASLLNLSDEELRARIEADPVSVGSLSIGDPGSAVLFNAVAMPPGARWDFAPGAISWGTAETMTAVQTAIDTVYELFPDTPPIVLGDISTPNGGRLKRHETHQAGRDVDFGFYLKGGAAKGYVTGTSANLDLARNWALVRALVVRTDVETILLDTRIQRLLYRHALGIGEDKDWLDRVFQFSRGYRDAIVRHVAGHRNHYHVRFYNPVAQELGRRAHPILVELGLMNPPVFTVKHVVRPGQTLGHLATRYGTSVRAIMQANGLRSTLVRAGRVYRIPMRTAAPPAAPVVVPPRLVPPSTPPSIASIAW